MQGIREVVAFGAVDRSAAALADEGRVVRQVQVRHAGRVGLEKAVTDVLVTAGVLVVLLVASLLVSGGGLDGALLPLVVVLAASAFTPVSVLGQTTVELGRIGAAAERLDVLLTAEPEVVDRPAATAPTQLEPAVRFEDVRFRYATHLPEVLRGVSFDVPAGRTVALVGHSGAGKSTCASLLLRLWEVTDGAVRLGGVDVRDLTQDALRERLTAVPQDVHLFAESLRTNLVLGRPDADDAAVRAAATTALLDEVVEGLPDGWDTAVGERGTWLSGGQRQRVAIARALLRDAPVLVLDEAVSSLDAESEELVRTAMAEATRGRTTLVIAHRLSTIRTADLVVVLERGRVVQTGSYDELVAATGPFRRLVAAGLDA